MQSEAQRAAAARWAKKNMTVVGCKLTRSKAETFKAACKQLGTVPNQVLMKVINETIEKANELGGSGIT